MKKELQKQLIDLFGVDNLEKVCRLKILDNKLRYGGGLDDEEYYEHQDLVYELENVFPRF